MSLAIAIHGGAWNIPDDELEANREGVLAALRRGWELLEGGAGALDTVEAVVRVLEDDPVFNAGKGSHLNRLGRVEMDASIMEGDGLAAGAVAAVERIRNPVSLARTVLAESPHVLLVGRGATRFAGEHGFERCRSRDLLVGRAREQYLRIRRGDTRLVDEEFTVVDGDEHMGTVGAVALDGEGMIAAATSTGGTLDKYPGRVGDSPLIGAGTYADSRFGGASCTGWGEGIIRIVMAKTALERLAAGLDARAAGRSVLDDLDRIGGRAGMILVDPRGQATAVYNTPRMARGIGTSRQGLRVGVNESMQKVAPA